MAVTTITRRFRKRIALISLLVGILVAFHYSGILEPVERLGIHSYTWVLHKAGFQPMNTLAKSRKDKAAFTSLEEANAAYNDLESRYRNLQLQFSKQQNAIERSTLAQEQLEYIETIGVGGVAAAVIGKSTQSGQQTVTLNKGAKDGIREGQAVITEGNALVGIVTAVDDIRARVELITSPRFRLNAAIKNEQQSPGLITGNFLLGITMEYIPQFDVVAEGDAIVTNGKDERIPAGIPVGTVAKIETQAGSLFQRAAVEPFVDIQRIRIVTVIQ